MNIFTAPTIGPTLFGAVLSAAKSPVLQERKAGDFYSLIASYGVDPAFALAWGMAEHRMGTDSKAVVVRYGIRNWGDCRSRRKPGLGGKVIATDRGNFWAYDSWYASLDDALYRITDPAYNYQQAGVRTVAQMAPIAAPPGDFDNRPELWATNVTSYMAAWQAQDKVGGTKVAVQKPQITSRPSPNRGYNGAAFRPEAVVWHITAGSGASAVNWLTSPASNASANYVIMENGEIVELVNPEAGADGAAWANGDVQQPDLTNALIAGWVKAGTNPNLKVCSIEHAGQTSNNKGGSLTAAQIAATVRLTAWLCQRFGIAPDQDHILGHYQINNVTRHYCPGFSPAEWSSWVGQIAVLVNGGGAVSTPGGTIGEALKDQPVTPALPVGYMQPGQADSYTWKDAAGVIVYRKVRYYQPQDGKWYEAEWNNASGETPFVEVG